MLVTKWMEGHHSRTAHWVHPLWKNLIQSRQWQWHRQDLLLSLPYVNSMCWIFSVSAWYCWKSYPASVILMGRKKQAKVKLWRIQLSACTLSHWELISANIYSTLGRQGGTIIKIQRKTERTWQGMAKDHSGAFTRGWRFACQALYYAFWDGERFRPKTNHEWYDGSQWSSDCMSANHKAIIFISDEANRWSTLAKFGYRKRNSSRITYHMSSPAWRSWMMHFG